jgi:salicylate hydroxylase
LAKAFENWFAPVTQVIAGAQSVHRWALFDRDPLAQWSSGRVTLLGDACHPMPPFQAQGAGMAIEDAVVLTQCIARQEDAPEAALKTYEARRKPRTTKILMSARANMAIFHRSTTFSQAATYGPMKLAAVLAPAFINSRQDWIYGFDPTLG